MEAVKDRSDHITFRKTNAISNAEIIALLIECTHYSCEARY